GNVNWKPREMWGVSADYPVVRNWPLRAGVFFTETDVTTATRVCVIGHTVAIKLFQTADPLQQAVRIKNIPLTVIGVLERKGANMVGQDQDDIIVIPYTTVKQTLQSSTFDNVNAIMVSARTQEQMADAESQIHQLLLERHRIHPGEQPDFRV